MYQRNPSPQLKLSRMYTPVSTIINAIGNNHTNYLIKALQLFTRISNYAYGINLGRALVLFLV